MYSKVQIEEKTKKNIKYFSKKYLTFIEKARLARYGNTAIYVKDLVRISFCALFYKKIESLVSFFVYILGKLPNNIKETIYIKFLIKLMKILAKQRTEITGLRFKLQGRINR